MFTGIIEHLGTIESLAVKGSDARLTVRAPDVAPSLAIAKSVAVNGCCLTVVALDAARFSADLSAETLRCTSFAQLPPGARVNLELPLAAGKEFGGHFVQGHVDGVGRVARIVPQGENWALALEVPPEIARYVALKGSIAVDGISLTVADWRSGIAEIAVIPFTYANTNLKDRKPGDPVNLEADMIAKHIERILAARRERPSSRLTLERLISEGF
ncbi:MAG TPA: riboflavin synthase [Methylomirabilota bacterium]|nr:riboflavin synthase [Methylomirabilota bacterium]